MSIQNKTKSNKEGCPFHQEISSTDNMGQQFQPFVNPQLDDPYPFYKRARNEEPIFYSPLLNAYVLTRYDDILNVLKDTVRFSSKNSLQTVGELTPEVIEVLHQGFPFLALINTDGPLHKRLRAPFMKVFAPERLEAAEDSIRAIANRLIDNFINDGRADIISQFARPLPLEVILTMYGVPLEKMPEVKQCGNSTSALFSSQLTPERQIEYARHFVALQHFFADLIEERRIKPGNDLISELQTSELTTPELALLLCEMVIAGHKTTGSFIGTALKLFLERPQIWQNLCKEPSLIKTALEEVLRYDTPAQSMARVTTQEVSLLGVTLPKNTRILLLYGSANRDSHQYADSDNFDVERFKDTPAKHLAFSHGVHHCLGYNLARREGRISLEVLSSRLPNLRLCPNQKLTHVPTLIDRGYERIDVEWDVPN